jgi:hypothetical protein
MAELDNRIGKALQKWEDGIDDRGPIEAMDAGGELHSEIYHLLYDGKTVAIDVDACAKYMYDFCDGDKELLENHQWTEAMMDYLNNNCGLEDKLTRLIEEM